jgi:flagellar export protein FliJ
MEMGAPFRLQQVLEHKRRLEEAKTLELATLTAEQRRCRADLDALREKEEAQLAALQEIAKAGAVDPARLDAALAYLDNLEGSISRQAELADALEAKVLESRDELVGILKEKQMLERLQEEHAETARGDAQRREGAESDDLATRRFLSGREGTA